MAKAKIKNSKKDFKIFPYFILSLLIILALILIIFFIKKVYLLSNEIISLKSGQPVSLNANSIMSVKVNNPGAIISDKSFSLPETQQNFDDLSFKASPDGSNFAYINRGNPETLYVNGKETASSEKISFVEFSTDGKRLAYAVKNNGKDQVILDGQAGQAYDWIFMPYFFTPDNRYFIYKARKDEGDVIVFNNIESKAYDKIYSVFVTSDKKQLVFYARKDSEIWKTTINLNDLSFK
jgi:hypothetical protein